MAMSSPIGAMPPPPGITPNFDNPKDELHTLMIATQVLCITIVSVFVFLRVYVRIRIMHDFGREDWTCVISWVLCLAYCVVAGMMAKYGAGYNQWDITTETITKYFKAGYVATIVYMPMAFLVKLALLFIIARVFSPYKKTVLFINLFIGFLFAYYASGLVIKARPCWPVSAYWRGELDKCLDQRAIIICDSVASVFSDLIILLLPVPLVGSLNMELKKKLRVMGILAAGGLATGFSVYRLIMIVMDGKSANQTMVFARVVLSGNAEIGIGLICACLPALNALIGRNQRDEKNSSRWSGRTANRDVELNKVRSTFTGLKSGHETESDKDYLMPHSPMGPGYETSIHRVTPPASVSRVHRQQSSLDRHGITKTVVVAQSFQPSKGA